MNLQSLNKFISNPSLLQNNQAFSNHLSIYPKNVNHAFFQTILYLLLIKNNHKYSYNFNHQHLQNLFENYSYSYSLLILKYQYTYFAFQNNINLNQFKLFNNIYFNVINWAASFQKQLSKSKFSLESSLTIFLRISKLQSFEDIIAFINFVASPRLISLIKAQSNQSKQQSNQVKEQQMKDKNQSQNRLTIQKNNKSKINRSSNPIFKLNLNKKIQILDLLNFVICFLPKIYYNIIIPKISFPQNYFYKINKNDQQNMYISLLYKNQNLQSLIKESKIYCKFIKEALVILLNCKIEQTWMRSFVLLAFNYYYIFHDQIAQSKQQLNLAQQIIVKTIYKLPITIKYSVVDEIYLFIRVLQKLGKWEFINYLKQQFGDWFKVQILQKLQQLKLVGHPIDKLYPYPGQIVQASSSVSINPGEKTMRIIEIYHNYTLLYFKIKSAKDDITIRLIQLSEFLSPNKTQTKIHFQKQKISGQFSKPIQFYRPGIYALQFDNSYSWVKDKYVQYQISILVPMQIVQDQECFSKKESWINLIFPNYKGLSRVPQQNLLKKVALNQQKRNLAEKLANIPEKRNSKDFKQFLTLNIQYKQKQKSYSFFYVERFKGNSSTKTYEYQSKDPQIFKKKLKDLRFGVCFQIAVFGKKVNNLQQALQQFQANKNIDSFSAQSHQQKQELQQIEHYDD